MIWTPECLSGEQRRRVAVPASTSWQIVSPFRKSQLPTGKYVASSGKASENCTSVAADGPSLVTMTAKLTARPRWDAEGIRCPGKGSGDPVKKVPVGVHLDDLLLRPAG